MVFVSSFSKDDDVDGDNDDADDDDDDDDDDADQRGRNWEGNEHWLKRYFCLVRLKTGLLPMISTHEQIARRSRQGNDDATEIVAQQEIRICKRARLKEESIANKRARYGNPDIERLRDCEKLKVQFHSGTTLQLLQSGKSASLSLDILHYTGYPTTAVHSGSFKVLESILLNGFDRERDSNRNRHAKDKGWLAGEKGMYFGNLNKSYPYTHNPDGRGKSGEVMDLGDQECRISYQGVFVAGLSTQDSNYGKWKLFIGDKDDEMFSAVNVPVVGAFVLQTRWRMERLPEFLDPEWQKLAHARCKLLDLSELRHIVPNSTDCTQDTTKEDNCPRDSDRCSLTSAGKPFLGKASPPGQVPTLGITSNGSVTRNPNSQDHHEDRNKAAEHYAKAPPLLGSPAKRHLAQPVADDMDEITSKPSKKHKPATCPEKQTLSMDALPGIRSKSASSCHIVPKATGAKSSAQRQIRIERPNSLSFRRETPKETSSQQNSGKATLANEAPPSPSRTELLATDDSATSDDEEPPPPPAGLPNTREKSASSCHILPKATGATSSAEKQTRIDNPNSLCSRREIPDPVLRVPVTSEQDLFDQAQPMQRSSAPDPNWKPQSFEEWKLEQDIRKRRGQAKNLHEDIPHNPRDYNKDEMASIKEMVAENLQEIVIEYRPERDTAWLKEVSRVDLDAWKTVEASAHEMLVSRLPHSTRLVMEMRNITAHEALCKLHNYFRSEIVEVLPKEGKWILAQGACPSTQVHELGTLMEYGKKKFYDPSIWTTGEAIPGMDLDECYYGHTSMETLRAQNHMMSAEENHSNRTRWESLKPNWSQQRHLCYAPCMDANCGKHWRRGCVCTTLGMLFKVLGSRFDSMQILYFYRSLRVICSFREKKQGSGINKDAHGTWRECRRQGKGKGKGKGKGRDTPRWRYHW